MHPIKVDSLIGPGMEQYRDEKLHKTPPRQTTFLASSEYAENWFLMQWCDNTFYWVLNKIVLETFDSP